MKIGKATVPRTAICTSDEHTIVVRGRDLSKELIGKVSFVEHFFLLLNARMPSAGELAVVNATLVAIAEHGLVPSVQAARMTFAAAPDAVAVHAASLDDPSQFRPQAVTYAVRAHAWDRMDPALETFERMPPG